MMPVDLERAVDAGPFRLGVRTRLFNYNLWHAIRRTGKSTKQVAAELGFSVGTLYQYQGFRAFPREERRISMAIYFAVPVDALFPESIAGVRIERQPDPIALTGDEAIAAGWVTGSGADPVLELEQSDLRERIDAVLGTLTAYEAEVLRLRVGLDGAESRTLEEVSREVGVTRERVRQVEQKALRKLRHPSRTRGLRGFLEPDEEPRWSARAVEAFHRRWSRTFDSLDRFYDADPRRRWSAEVHLGGLWTDGPAASTALHGQSKPAVGPSTRRAPLFVPRFLRRAAPQTGDLVATFIRAKVAKGLSPKTIGNYESELRLFARAHARLPLEPGPIEQFLAERGPAPETRITYHRTLRTLYRWAQRRGTITSNPADLIDTPVMPKRIARALEPDEVRRLLAYPDEIRVRAFLLLLVDTGIRLSEALTLTKQDLGERTLLVRGKTGERVVPISPFVRVAVVNALPWPWTRADTASKGVRRAFEHAGLDGKRASAHTLRHTFSRLWEGDETLLMKILGHTSLRMLHERYRPYNVKRALSQHRLHIPIRYVA